MATFLVESDDYAGWNPTGRNFSLTAAAGGLIGLLSWLCLHGYLGALRPSAASDQFFLGMLVWIGGGCFALMGIAGLGSICLSWRSHGTVTVTEEGVIRSMRARSLFLAWPDIQGLVPMPYGGVTLVASPGKTDIVVPRFLDDYRACIAEIKFHGVRALPPSSLRRKPEKSWPSILRSFFFLFFYLHATEAHVSHVTAIGSLVAAAALMIWTLREEDARALPTTPGWLPTAVFVVIGAYALWRIAIHW